MSDVHATQRQAIDDALDGLDAGDRVQVFGAPESGVRYGEALCTDASAASATVIYHVHSRPALDAHFCLDCGHSDVDDEN